MNTPLVIKSEITINAPATKVWDALTMSEWTKQYMFGCEALSDWLPGSPLIWKGNFNGVEMVAVKGHVVSIQPPQTLVYTVIDPNNPAIPDLPENYLTVTCQLTEQNGHTHLTVTQGDYRTVADGENRYKHSVDGGGWDPILVQIRQLLESAE
ncbi:SRPBCC domain-containing protein [Puia dinghuensis]|uniref:Transcriptional regulator n=1 Tax=Puia dinghuensis TaxID=1792502 RepID=A0A8J2UDW3_9BACT|nr:SRPBCC domain-containing protein [Puia dinghuensis]GGB02912.1 transcriptional regulator [Puia dinghuensis]